MGGTSHRRRVTGVLVAGAIVDGRSPDLRSKGTYVLRDLPREFRAKHAVHDRRHLQQRSDDCPVVQVGGIAEVDVPQAANRPGRRIVEPRRKRSDHLHRASERL